LKIFICKGKKALLNLFANVETLDRHASAAHVGVRVADTSQSSQAASVSLVFKEKKRFEFSKGFL
jgi:hypothetical protein